MDRPRRPQRPEREGNPLELIAIPRKSVICLSLSLFFNSVWLILCQISTVLTKDLSLSSRLNCKWNDSTRATASTNPLPAFLFSHRTAAGSAQFMSQCHKASSWITTVTPQPHQHISFSPKCHPYTLSDIWASSLKSPMHFCPGMFHSSAIGLQPASTPMNKI